MDQRICLCNHCVSTPYVVTAAIIVVAVIVVIFVMMYYLYSEQLMTKSEKAAIIVDWFGNNPAPRYVDFRSDVPNGNIIEYEDAKTLRNNGKLSQNEMVKKL